MEGLPPDASSSDVFDVAEMRRERRRSELEALALAICAAIGANLGAGGSEADVVRPFYSRREWEARTAEADAAREMSAQIMQIEKLRRMQGSWQRN